MILSLSLRQVRSENNFYVLYSFFVSIQLNQQYIIAGARGKLISISLLIQAATSNQFDNLKRAATKISTMEGL